MEAATLGVDEPVQAKRAATPNYNLQRAHDNNEFLHQVPEINRWQGLKTARLKLIDEASGRLVTFGQARRSAAAAPQLNVA